jgi:Flp pilus assembly protein TadG
MKNQQVYSLSKGWSQRGAAAVEMAVLLPVLTLIIFGIIEFGTYLYNQQVLTNASREGARAGIVQQTPRVTDSAIGQIVNNYASGRLVTFGNGGTSPSTVVASTGTGFGSNLTVTATYQYSFLVVGNLIPGLENPRTMRAATTMKFE